MMTSQTPYIIHSSPEDEYYFEEGCYILELSNSDNDNELSIAQARVLPNTSTKLHKLSGVVERYIILQGIGEVLLGEQEPAKVTQGNVVIIPAQCPQAIKNIGNDDLVFLVLCTPRFTVDCYQEC